MSLPDQIQTSPDNTPDKKIPRAETLSSVTENTKKEVKEEKTAIIDKKLDTLEDKQYLTLEAKKKMISLISASNMGKQFEQKQADLQEKMPGFTLDTFAENISKPVGEYLWQTFAVDNKLSLDKEILTSMSVGIQGAMMEALKTSWSEETTKLFDSFSGINFGKTADTFSWLFSTFGSVFHKAGNINYFYQLATKVQNCTQYLATHAKSWEMTGQYYHELMEPNKFRLLLASPVWEDSEALHTKSLQEVWLHAQVGDVTKDQAKEFLTKDEEAFKYEVLDVADVNPAALASINKALPKAMELLEKRGEYRKHTSELMTRVGSVLNMNLFGIGTVGTLLGISSPAKLLKKSKLANFVLKMMGFDGVDGLHREYIRDQIALQNSPEKRTAIKAFFDDYKKQTPDAVAKADFLSTYKISFKQKEYEQKLPTNVAAVRQSLFFAVKGNEKRLSLQTLRALKIPFSTVENNKKEEVLDEGKFDASLITEQVMDKYLALTIPTLAKNRDFMKEITSPDQFLLAVVGNAFVGQTFVEGVCIGVENPANYLPESATAAKLVDTKNLSDEKKKELSSTIQKELSSVSNCPLTAEMVLSACQKYPDVPAEYVLAIMKNDSTYGTAGRGARTHNPGNVGNTDSGASKDWWTREAGVEAVAQNLHYRIAEYIKMYTKEPFPLLKSLADNIGPDGRGFLSNQGNYKQLNSQRLGAYMWSTVWSENVRKFSENLAQAGISTKESLSV